MHDNSWTINIETQTRLSVLPYYAQTLDAKSLKTLPWVEITGFGGKSDKCLSFRNYLWWIPYSYNQCHHQTRNLTDKQVCKELSIRDELVLVELGLDAFTKTGLFAAVLLMAVAVAVASLSEPLAVAIMAMMARLLGESL